MTSQLNDAVFDAAMETLRTQLKEAVAQVDDEDAMTDEGIGALVGPVASMASMLLEALLGVEADPDIPIGFGIKVAPPTDTDPDLVDQLMFSIPIKRLFPPGSEA